jgi:site-specific recombinase XerD
MKVKINAVLYPQQYANGEQPIFIRIYVASKRSYIASGYSIPSGAWNKQAGDMFESMPTLTKKLKETLSEQEIKAFRKHQKGIILHPKAAKINSEIRGIISELEKIMDKMKHETIPITAEALKKRYEDKDKHHNARQDFLEYIKQAADRKYRNSQIRTSEKYLVLLRKLQTFRQGKPLPVDDLDTALLKDFQLYLKQQGSHQNYIHVNLKTLRTIIQKEAIKEDRIISPDKNPFIFFDMPKVLPTKKERLDEKEIIKIEALDLQVADPLYHIRNAFLFSYYNAGIRIGDLLQLQWGNINSGRLEYFMGKTGKQRSIELQPQALKILQRYQASNPDQTGYIFPFLDSQAKYAKIQSPEDFQKASPELLSFLYSQTESKIASVNQGLKHIAMKAGIKKRLTSHIARHSFADYARKKETSLYDIKNMLGHSKIGITEVYLSDLDTGSMDKAMKQIFNTTKP